MPTKRRLAWILCTLGLACDPKSAGGPSPPAAPAPFQIEVLSTGACEAGASPSEKANRIFGVKVRITGKHSSGVPANYFYGSVLSTRGDRYLAELSGCSPALVGPPLFEGEAREGYLNFPMPPEKRPEILVYSPLVGTLKENERTVQVALSTAPDGDEAEEEKAPSKAPAPEGEFE